MEDFVFSTQILTEFDFSSPKEYKVRAIIFLVENKIEKKLYEKNLLGKQMKDWVVSSVGNVESVCVNLEKEEDVFKKAKENIKDEDYTICLFSDTPLIKNNSIVEALDYAQTKELDFCRLPRGFIVKSKNFLKDEIFLSSEANFLEKQEFFSVFNQKTLCLAKDVLRKRIIDEHLKNGVLIEDLNSVSIDCDVKIESGVNIKQNNIIEGNTTIKKDCLLQPFNYIKDCEIAENCNIKASYLENCKIKKDSIIGPFASVINKKEK